MKHDTNGQILGNATIVKLHASLFRGAQAASLSFAAACREQLWIAHS